MNESLKNAKTHHVLDTWKNIYFYMACTGACTGVCKWDFLSFLTKPG